MDPIQEEELWVRSFLRGRVMNWIIYTRKSYEVNPFKTALWSGSFSIGSYETDPFQEEDLQNGSFFKKSHQMDSSPKGVKMDPFSKGIVIKWVLLQKEELWIAQNQS